MSSDPATPNPTVPQTHPKGFFFLFAGEFAERFSFYGMRAILPLYLSDQMGFGEGTGARYYTFFLAAAYLLPLLGGWIAVALLVRLYTRPALRRLAATWLVGITAGVAIRAAILGRTHAGKEAAFLGVALALTLLFALIARLLAGELR